MTTDLITGTEPEDTAVSPADDAYLRAESIVKAINAALPKGVKPLPLIPEAYKFRKRDRETAQVAFHSAFELSGGVAALQAWAMQNPDKFYPLFAKVMQGETGTGTGNTTINVMSAIPTSPLDLVNVGQRGRVFTVASPEEEEDL